MADSVQPEEAQLMEFCAERLRREESRAARARSIDELYVTKVKLPLGLVFFTCLEDYAQG